jgi:hypothetical protein
MTDDLRIYRPPNKRHRQKPKTGQERLAQARRDGGADGRKWVHGKHRRGDLYIGAYFEAFTQAAKRAFHDVMRTLQPPVLPGVGDLIFKTKEIEP